MSQRDARLAVLSGHVVQAWPERIWRCGDAWPPSLRPGRGGLVAFQRMRMVAGFPAPLGAQVVGMAVRVGGAIILPRAGVAETAVVTARRDPDDVSLTLLRRAHAVSARVMAASDDMLAGLLRRAH